MFDWFSSTRIIHGEGAISRIKGEMARHGAERAVLLTDPGVEKTGLAGAVADSMGALCVGVFGEITRDTGFEVIDAACDFASGLEADSVVSVGGGSVMDTGKVLSVLLREGGKAKDHAGLYVLKRGGVTHICIPTTAGTGSEVTSVAVVLSDDRSRKVYYLSEYLSPHAAILDPSMTLGLPRALTASTGMDAITHAIEATVSKLKNPIATALAMGAVRIIRSKLPECVRNGTDIASRADMQVAATMAGMAFNSAPVGLAHCVAHAAGALCGVPHGVANGIVLPAVMRHNSVACFPETARLAREMGVPVEGKTDEETAELATTEVENLLREIDHPRRFSEVGVKESDIGLIAELALTDPALFTNPRECREAAEVEKIIREVF